MRLFHLIFLLLWVNATAHAADPNKVIRIAFGATDEGFDPVRSANYYSGVVLDAVGERLLTYDYLARPAKLIPGVAVAMPEVTDQGTTYTFKLRQGVYFNPDPAFGGKKRELTAEDFVFSIKRFLDPALRSQWRFLFDGKIKGLDAVSKQAEKSGKFDYAALVEGLRALDRYTLQIRLTQPDYNFSYIVAMPAVIPVTPETIAAYKDDVGAHPVGTGAYQLTEYQRGNRIVLTANPNFTPVTWNFAASEPGDEKIVAQMHGKTLPQIGRIEINYIEEEQSNYLAFMNGQLDYISGASTLAEHWREGAGVTAELRAMGITRRDVVEPETTYTMFNMRDPVTGGYTPEKTALRRALIMAYDAQSEIDVLRKGMARQNDMLVPPGVNGHNPRYRSINRYHPDAANKLLDRYGYQRGADGWRLTPEGKPLVITLTSEPRSTSREFDELWRKSLARIHVRLAVKKGSFAENLKAAKACQLQMWGSAWIADYPDGENFLQLLYGKNAGQSNNACYDSPTFNRLYEKSLTLPDSPARNALYELMTRQAEIDGVWRIGVSRIRSTLLHRNVIGYKKHPVMHAEWMYMDIDLDKPPLTQGGGNKAQ